LSRDHQGAADGPTEQSKLARIFGRIVDVREDELRALLLSCAYFFCVLSAYYVLRPIRDEMGIAGGVRNLPWLFTGTLLATLAAQPFFAALVARFPRRQFIPYTYRFFMLNLVGFFILLKVLPAENQVWVGRAFFIWTSVFNLFVVSVFWAFMADVFHPEQGKRLFGFIGVGGTAGGIVGGMLTAVLAQRIGPPQLFLISVVLLELAAQCVRRFPAGVGAATPAQAEGDVASADSPAGRQRPAPSANAELPIGGSIIAGITHVAKSPYLIGIALYMLLFTLGSTFLYYQQAAIIEQHFTDRALRTSVLARIDVAVNVLTIVTQVFLTGRLVRLLGIGVTLALIPALSVLGFLGLGLMPSVGLLVTFLVLRRAGEFAVARPVREVLFTVIPREDKYKAKSFIDTFVYRAGDQVGAWSYGIMMWLGMGMAAIAFTAVPIAVVWLLIAIWLGRRQRALQHAYTGPAIAAHVPAPARG